ncbi:MAG: hypothetical protein IPM64_05250 [Phycisphaerales bacterium]|nr:hypothetical protein [Phycisphaerales bacterium]
MSVRLTRLSATFSLPWVSSALAMLCRAGWALMLVVHAPGMLSAWGLGDRPVDAVRAAGLLAACVLFVLKIADVRWLRLPRDRRVWLAVAIGAALLHAGVVAPDLLNAVPEFPVWSAVFTLALVVASAPILCAIRTAQRRLAELEHSLLGRLRAAALHCSLRRALRMHVGVVTAVRPPPRFPL